MATHKSAAKRARQSVKRNVFNRAQRSKVHTLIKAAEASAAGKDGEATKKALRAAEAALAHAAGRKAMHWKTAARKTSRLVKRIKATGLKKAAK